MEIGSLVKSTKGRDKDRCYLVISIIDNRLVNVVDGSIKQLVKPKKKNIKHLEEITVFKNLKEKILSNKQVFDKEINKAINTYMQSFENK